MKRILQLTLSCLAFASVAAEPLCVVTPRFLTGRQVAMALVGALQ